MQIGQVDDEGNTLLAGGKVTWPVKEANAVKGTTGTTSAGQTGNAGSKLPSNPTSQSGSGVAKPSIVEPVRFIEGVTVKDIKTGQSFSGTVDLKPTLDRILSGSSYPHKNDGSIFQNRPDKTTGQTGLPPQASGYYKEYVHPTPNISGPGPQRIVVGQKGETYYTNDHYKTFIRIE